MEPDIWLRPHGEDHYECIAVYVDDLLIVSKDPESAIDVLINKHSFKLKGTGPISYHLDFYFGRDDDCTLHFAHNKYIETMVGCYYKMFGTKTKLSFSLPLEKGDYPELDASGYLDLDSVHKYQ